MFYCEFETISAEKVQILAHTYVQIQLELFIYAPTSRLTLLLVMRKNCLYKILC